MSWIVHVHRRVRKWLKRHRGYEKVLDEIIAELMINPFIGERLRGKCKGYLKYKKKGKPLRVMYWIDYREHTIVIRAVGLRENFYEKYC